jgi:hypothetical protein
MALEDAKNPIAGVSGPGKYAKRTDRIPANSYGDQTELAQIASGAPIAKTPDTKGMPMGQVEAAAANAAPQASVTPLFAPTQRSDEPITNGVDVGPGAGSNALMMQKSTEKLSDALAQMLPYDTTGEVGILYQQALSRGM